MRPGWNRGRANNVVGASRSSVLRRAREGPVLNSHRGHDHAAEEPTKGPALAAHGDRASQGTEVTLGVAKVLDRAHDLAALDEEGPITGHAGHDRQLGMNP